jgi:hypothetical protein
MKGTTFWIEKELFKAKISALELLIEVTPKSDPRYYEYYREQTIAILDFKDLMKVQNLINHDKNN